MADQNIQGRVIFVVRYIGPTKIGPNRYRYILEAMKNALDRAEIRYENDTANVASTRNEKDRNEGFQMVRKKRREYKHSSPQNKSLSYQRGQRFNGRFQMRGRGGRGGQRGHPPTSKRGGHHDNYNDFHFEEPTNVLDPNEWPSITQQKGMDVRRPWSSS